MSILTIQVVIVRYNIVFAIDKFYTLYNNMCMKAVLTLLSILISVTLILFVPPSVSAATFRAGENVVVTENDNVSDLYASGGDIRVTSTVNNDLTVAGGNIAIEGSVTGGVLAAGGNITLDAAVANSARIAGGNIVISGPINRDLVIFGGSVTVSRDAVIGGDVVFTGGQLTLDAPVRGKVIINGGEIVINSQVGENVEGTVGELTLGNNAVINGTLKYNAPQRAEIREGARVKGQHQFTQTRDEEAERGVAGLLTAGTIYKLIADIIFALLFVFLLGRFTRDVIANAVDEPLKSLGLGLVTLIITPIVGLILLIVILPGVVLLGFYAVLLLISVVLAKLVLGWWLMQWWTRRNDREYVLDWKASVIGPIVMLALTFIPVVGWLIGFIIFLLALGGVTQELFDFLSLQRGARRVREAPARTVPARAARPKRRPTAK